MIERILAWIRKMFEDANGVPDDARIAAFIMVLTFCGNSVSSVIMSAQHTFDPQQFGIGAGALAAGLGAWFGMRKDS